MVIKKEVEGGLRRRLRVTKKEVEGGLRRRLRAD